MIQLPVVEEQPTRLPGECFSCKATQLSPGREWFLDTDVDYFDTPAYRIQVCNICFDLLANTCGYIKIGEEVEQYKKAIAQREAEIHELTRYRNLAGMLGITDDRLDRLLALNSSNLEPEFGDSLESGATLGSGEGQNQERVVRGTEGSSESTDDEGMAELRSTDVTIAI